MSKYKIGDKFIVEIDDVMLGSTAENNPTALYRIKGFNSLVFDKNGLDKLEKIPTSDAKDWSETIEAMEREYNRGLNDAWELARKIADISTTKERADIFGYCCDGITVSDILRDFTPQQAIAKLEAYEKSKQIQVGDVVYANGVQGVVIDIISDDDCYIYDENGCIEVVKFEKINKTGRTVDIEHLLEQIRGNE